MGGPGQGWGAPSRAPPVATPLDEITPFSSIRAFPSILPPPNLKFLATPLSVNELEKFQILLVEP